MTPKKKKQEKEKKKQKKDEKQKKEDKEEKTDEEYYKEAGALASKALHSGAKKIKKGVALLEVAEHVEKIIQDGGGELAFPVNISQNERAAHYTPSYQDDTKFEEDVVKLDVGAHIEGFIGDNALTIDLTGKHSQLVKASEKALEEAVKAIRPGVKSTEVGAVIENTIKDAGFKPIENLSGHVMRKYVLHSGLSLPNVSWGDEFTIEEGMAIAIEPFATTGRGRVTEEREVQIFSLNKPQPVRNRNARKILEHVVENHALLPFSERSLNQICSGFPLKAALKELVGKEIFEGHPILRDTGLVSQKEYTVLVTEDGCEVTTPPRK